jgi:lipoprotein-releasing system ATP-binding protein
METKTILRARNISKYFYQPVKFRVLDNISFEVSQGELLTIAGKSGSGKSTLLYVLSTMDTEYEGELFLEGEKITGLGQNPLTAIRNKSIGFVFQFHYLLPEFSCLKNVMIPALKLGRYSSEEIEQKACRYLELLGIRDQALKPASKLSGGQQQRVAIARALINNPKIIMCDEPTGNLDSKNTQIVFDIFRQISGELRQTVIVVTHDMDFAKTSDRVIELSDGRIIPHD